MKKQLEQVVKKVLQNLKKSKIKLFKNIVKEIQLLKAHYNNIL